MRSLFTRPPQNAKPAPPITERQIALGDLLNALPDPALLANADGSLLACNPPLLDLLEHKPVLNTAVSELFIETPQFNDDLQDKAHGILKLPGNACCTVEIRRAALPEPLSISLWYLCEVKDFAAAERELRRKSEAIEQASQDLEQFVFGASHDLKEPLRVINGHLDLVKLEAGDALNDYARESMEYALDGVRRAQSLIDGLLNYSRTGFQQADPKTVDARKCLDDALKNLARKIEESGASITIDPLPTIQANHNQLTVLFQNLVSNALKFVRGKSPVIHVGCETNGSVPRFSVSDNGVGIAPEHIERIFRIFERLHPSDQFEGSGIGLALCKRIVELHNGQIKVISEPGQGATFYFTLNSGMVAAAPRAGAVAPEQAPPPASTTALSTLLVDDVAGIRHLVRVALERSGHFSVCGQASTGLEGIEQATRLQPDVVLLDLSMPGMDGLEALPKILAASPHSKVVIYSGFEDRRLGKTARELGAAGYIEKGTEPKTLAEQLLQLATVSSA